MRLARYWAVATLLCLGTAQAASVQGVLIQVERMPGLTFNRQVPSTVTLTTPWGTQTASLSGGTLYASDPQHYWATLTPLRVRLNVPADAAAGHYPVSVRTTLYVCDQNLHLCTVRPTATQGQFEVGAAASGNGPLTLTLKVPGLRGF
ncbi:hypothetical protein [Deinococcus sp.]|uniref:hypothetical protein n=1 Tax=Deinococcus sp. TaxID=47478 RepID=UPI003C7AD315